MKEWIVRDQTPIRLDRFFSRELPDVSYGPLPHGFKQVTSYVLICPKFPKKKCILTLGLTLNLFLAVCMKMMR